LSTSLDFLDLPDGLEFVPETKATIPVTILRAGETGPTEPAFVVEMNRLTVEEFRKINRRVAAKLQGVRQGPKAQERYSEEWADAYAKKAFARWSGLTVRNFNAIKSFDLRLGGEREQELIKSGWEMKFSTKAASWLLRHSWAENFDTPTYNALKGGAEEVAEDEEGKGSD